MTRPIRPRPYRRHEILDVAREPAALDQQPLHAGGGARLAQAYEALRRPLQDGWLVKAYAVRIRTYVGRDGRQFAITLRDPHGRPHFFRARYIGLYPWLERWMRDHDARRGQRFAMTMPSGV